MRPDNQAFALPPILALAFALSACGDTTEAENVEPRPMASVPVDDYARVTPSTPPPTDVALEDCNARLASPYIGEQADAQTRGELLSAVAPVTNVRWVGPGTATTEDLDPDRLNVMLDAGDTITALSCG